MVMASTFVHDQRRSVERLLFAQRGKNVVQLLCNILCINTMAWQHSHDQEKYLVHSDVNGNPYKLIITLCKPLNGLLKLFSYRLMFALRSYCLTGYVF